MEDTIKFELTGNFQYDAGLVGLCKVLDFFEIESKRGSISVEFEKTLWNTFPTLVFLYTYWHKRKVLFMDCPAEKLKELLFSALKKDFKKEAIPTIAMETKKSEQKLLSYPGANLINSALLNRLNKGSKKVNDYFYFDEVTKIFERKNQEVAHTDLRANTCDFCGVFGGARINRMNFLFAPSAINYSWMEIVNMSICPRCECLSFFAPLGCFHLGNSVCFIHSHNFEEMIMENSENAESLADYLYKTFVEANPKTITNTVERHFAEKTGSTIIRAEAEYAEKMLIGFTFSTTNPMVRLSYFSAQSLQFVHKYKKDIIDLNRIDPSFCNQILLAIFEDAPGIGISVREIINVYFTKARTKPREFSMILKALNIYHKYKGGESMSIGNKCLEFGQQIRRKVREMKSGKTADNKLISIAYNLRDAALQGETRLKEELLGISVYTSLPAPLSLLKAIEEKSITPEDVGLTIAVGIMARRDI